MKQLTFTFIFLLTSTLLFSQIQWTSQFPTGNGSGGGKFILENSSGQYLMLVNANDANSNAFAYIQKTGINGGDLGQQLFSDISTIYGAIILSTNDDIVVVGTKGQDIVLTKLDASLNMIWETILDMQRGWSPVGNILSLASNGDLIVAGRKTPDNPAFPPDWVAQRFTADGTFIWEHIGTKDDGDSSTAFEFASCAIDVNGENTLVAGAYQFAGDGSFLRMLDVEGKTIWTTYFNLNNGAYQVPNKIIQSNLGFHVASFADNGNGKLSPSLSLFDDEGVNIFSNFYNPGTNAELNTAMVETQLGNFYLSYCINDSINVDKRNGYFVKISPQGEELCSLEFVVDNFLEARPYDIKLTPDNGLVAFGWTRDGNQSERQPFAIKVEDLCVLQNTNNLENQIPIAVNVFPNPNTTGDLHLELDSEINTQLQYSIINILGKKVKASSELEIFQGQNNFSFDVSQLPKGSYFIKLDHENFQKSIPFNVL